MVLGKSARKMAILTKIPRSNLMRWFQKLTGQKANAKKPLTKVEMDKYLPLARAFRPPPNGYHTRYFLDDEEEMFVIALEEAHNAAFPWDVDALIHLAESVGKTSYEDENFTVSPNWVRGFERRWKKRLSKVKCGSISKMRGKKATTEVRDAVFKLFNSFMDRLVEDGKFTQSQRENLDQHLCNADEVGGDEKGKGKSKVYKGRQRNAAWRTVDLSGDHNPFHVTMMLVSMAVGKIAKAVQLIHSAPGATKGKPLRLVEELYDHLPGHWSLKRTSTGAYCLFDQSHSPTSTSSHTFTYIPSHVCTGSMTLELFDDWATYFVSRMESEGFGAKHNHPLVLLIDGHSSHWSHQGLHTLIKYVQHTHT